MHDLPLISTIAAAFTAAWLFGILAKLAGLSPIVGYLVAGVLIGPYTPGFVGDTGLATQLAEVGVILLMFGVGLHFHLKDLVAVRKMAIPGAVGQSLLATVAAMALFAGFGMDLSTGAVLGMAMAVASTVVLMRVLMDANAMNTPEGHVAVGWLIVEDIFTVVLLVLIPVLGTGGHAAGHAAAAMAEGKPLWWTLGLALVKLAVLVVVVLWAGSRVIPRLLVWVAKLRSRELFTLTVLVFSVAVAAASYFFFGASMALGAFLAGMVVAQSPVSNQAAADALPMRDAFAVLFFVSVGMLFDPSFLLREPLMILAALGVILLVKPLAALLIVALLGHSVRTGLTVALGLAQIGEFSFILSELARRHGLMSDEGHNVLVAAAILSITLNPWLFRSLPGIERWLRGRPLLWRWLNGRAEKRVARGLAGVAGMPSHMESGAGSPCTVLVGYGPVGRTVHHVLEEAGIGVVVIDLNIDTVEGLRKEGKAAVFGDAANSGILEEAGVKSATHLVVTVPGAAQRAGIVTAARHLNEGIRVVARVRYLRERDELARSGVNLAVFEEAEAAVALARVVLAGRGVHRDAARSKLEEIRFQLAVDSFPDLRRLKVRAAMVPWEQVRTVASDQDRAEVGERIARWRHHFVPVVGPDDGKPHGYLVRDELLGSAGDSEWAGLVHSVQTVHAEETVGGVFERMRESGEAVFLVQEGAGLLGMVTRGHLMDRIEGDFAKGKARPTPARLGEALARGGFVPELAACNIEEAIREMAGQLETGSLPAGVRADDIARLVLEAEKEGSTDLGDGIAVPHVRCEGLAAPVAVIGRSHEGIVGADGNGMPVRLVILLVTPANRPEDHLALLAQVARLLVDPARREALANASTLLEVLEVAGHRVGCAGETSAG